MDKNILFTDEQLITESDNKQITLTSHRVRFNSFSWGHAHIVSIMLEKISSIEVHYNSWVIVLFLGILSVLAGLVGGAGNQGQIMVMGLVVGAVLILIYFFTRKHVVTIASDGGAKINFATAGMKRDVIVDFINKIEKAKNERAKSLGK